MRRVEDELRRRAVHDDLTGLPNRALLTDRLEQALARVQREGDRAVAVMFVDLDHFKLVNDSWGHTTGDVLLRQVAERIRTAIRPGDTVARFGGDEFVVVCEVTDAAEAEQIARRVVASFTDRFDVEDQTMYAGASVGIAVSPPASAGELLRFADVAMYDAKARGRGRVQMFDVALAEKSAERLILGNDLRDALENNRLDMHYQPIVELTTGAVVSLEALARWRHPQRGLIPAAQFVGIAETAGMGPALDRWALTVGCRDAQLLRQRLASPIRVAVNVSAANLADPTLERNLMSTLAAISIPTDLLILEITESALMEQPEQARETIRRLGERGIATAIDDFGTGYSSLAYLNQLPVQTLKIDRSFVAGLAEDEDAFAIVAAIVDLARILGVRTVAEGVETREQLALLQRLGCWAGQGYLWARPMPLEDTIAAVASRPSERFDVASDGARSAPAGRRRKEPVTSEHGLQMILRLHRQGASLSTIAAALNSEGFRTPQGMRWHRATIARVIRDVAFPGLLEEPG
jgi:diguanylate cyclase (GGDEF)-like protein